MNTPSSVGKSDFIKFNVSPKFKAQVAKKARASGLTLSELGRRLFGAFVHNSLPSTTISDMSPRFRKLAEDAKEWHRQGKGKTFDNAKDAIAYLDSLEK